jgi:hypothetical protein
MLKTETKDFVEYFSPGTFFAESSMRPCKYGDIMKALEMARGVKERYGATPYGFRFYRERLKTVEDEHGNKAVQSTETVDKSGMYFITGTVLHYDDVADTDENRILRSNMMGNNWPFMCDNRNSWRSSQPFHQEDCVVDLDGKIVERGNSPERMQARAEFEKRRDAHYARV